jgi:hypothetical protein
MTYNIGGLQYENSIVNSIRQILSRFDNRVNFVNINFETAGFSNVGIDLELMVNNNHFNLEIKQNKKAQMGETSIRYNPLTDDAEIVNEEIVDFAAKLFYLNAVRSKKDDILAILNFLKQHEPKEFHNKLPDCFPLAGITREAWNSAKKLGLLKALSSTVRFEDTSIIANAYNLKKIYYIQLGGSGLFYLNENPYNLPIPKFEGAIQIEFRLKRNGGDMRKIDDKVHKILSAGYICAGRLLTNIKSPLSFDNPEDAFKILSYIDDQTNNP